MTVCVCVCAHAFFFSPLSFRYLFSLQMKRDLMEGRLICTENTGALLASHLVQCKFFLFLLKPTVLSD